MVFLKILKNLYVFYGYQQIPDLVEVGAKMPLRVKLGA